MSARYPDATSIATSVRKQELTAQQVMTATLAQIAAQNQTYNCFTTVLAEAAMTAAMQIDRAIATGTEPGVLAGVPFAVKDLFDITGIPTRAGSKINATRAPAQQDATLITRLKQAGAVLVGALNMDEYAYGFTTENGHYGPTSNPHDLTRIAGGSSGGSAAAVAAGLVPISLGSDTNGSIRVPAALCGILGLKPTYGRLSRAGAYLFSGSFDHVGPFARSVRDLATVFDLLQGHDPLDPVNTTRPIAPCSPELTKGSAGLSIAIADGYFAQGGTPEVFAAVDQIAAALGTTQRVTLPEVERARAAAFIITACEGANLHLADLKQRPQDFDSATRDRFLAGCLVPGTWVMQAQRLRSWFRQQVSLVFQSVDIILAPTTPCIAPLIGQTTMTLDGVEVLTRPNLGLFTQPLSFIGLPVLSVPVQRPNATPVGVQIIAAPYNEALLLRVAAELEAQGTIAAPVAPDKSHRQN